MSVTSRFVEAMNKNRRRLFHFTDSRNIPSIAGNGLLTTAELRDRGIDTVTGGDADSLGIDKHKGLDQFVRLSFCRTHPMSHIAQERGSIETVRILTISPDVLLRDGVRIADQVATANEAVIGEPDEMIPKMDLLATYQYLDWKVAENYQRRNAAEKWEALIPGTIEIKDIFGL
tara:strand:+ start:1034 stop:1555 length:522 start_codon:yes stop_codon:yes gene_type:complete